MSSTGELTCIKFYINFYYTPRCDSHKIKHTYFPLKPLALKAALTGLTLQQPADQGCKVRRGCPGTEAAAGLKKRLEWVFLLFSFFNTPSPPPRRLYLKPCSSPGNQFTYFPLTWKREQHKLILLSLVHTKLVLGGIFGLFPLPLGGENKKQNHQLSCSFSSL